MPPLRPHPGRGFLDSIDTGSTQGFDPSSYRQLGDTDLHLSPIGLGTVKFGRNTGLKYPVSFQLPEYSELVSLVGLAKELGINLLDTAPAYGDSEQKIGKMIEGQRHDWVLSTKVGEKYENGISSFDFSASATRRSIENSLRNLRTDYLDLVFIHLGDEDERTLRESDIIDTLSRLKHQGKIRAIGASTKTVEGGLTALKRLDTLMVAYSLEDQSQEPVIQYASRHQKGIILKKALASGHAMDIEQNLRFILGKSDVTSSIIGTIDPLHLEQNISIAAPR